MTCPACQKHPAIIDKKYGVLNCQACQKRQSGYTMRGGLPEMTTESIKQQRKEFWSDYHPAHRSGHASKEYLERWGAKKMQQQGFSDQEIKTAKYVYNGDKYYDEH